MLPRQLSILCVPNLKGRSASQLQWEGVFRSSFPTFCSGGVGRGQGLEPRAASRALPFAARREEYLPLVGEGCYGATRDGRTEGVSGSRVWFTVLLCPVSCHFVS